jgi:hypothetical protein
MAKSSSVRCTALIDFKDKYFVAAIAFAAVSFFALFSCAQATRQAGHTWPDGRQYLPARRVGRTTRDINGCDEIWQFFRSLN